MTEPSFEECMEILERMKKELAELRTMMKEHNATKDEISFIRAWMRILKRIPEYVI